MRFANQHKKRANGNLCERRRDSPYDSLSTRSNRFKILITLQYCELRVSHLHGVQCMSSTHIDSWWANCLYETYYCLWLKHKIELWIITIVRRILKIYHNKTEVILRSSESHWNLVESSIGLSFSISVFVVYKGSSIVIGWERQSAEEQA